MSRRPSSNILPKPRSISIEQQCTSSHLMSSYLKTIFLSFSAATSSTICFEFSYPRFLRSFQYKNVTAATLRSLNWNEVIEKQHLLRFLDSSPEKNLKILQITSLMCNTTNSCHQVQKNSILMVLKMFTHILWKTLLLMIITITTCYSLNGHALHLCRFLSVQIHLVIQHHLQLYIMQTHLFKKGGGKSFHFLMNFWTVVF